MPFKCPDAPATSSQWPANQAPAIGSELPHLNRFIQAPTDQALPIRRECNAIHAILVAVRPIKSANDITSIDVPNPDTLVEGAGGDIFTIRGNCYSGDAILNSEGKDFATTGDVPDTDSVVATSRGDEAAVAGEVKGIYILFVASESVTDGAACDIPDLTS